MNQRRDRLDTKHEDRLAALARMLIDPAQATVAVPVRTPQSGDWFGGGNLTQGPDGALYLVGRYRVAGDSRSGLAAGERGNELAIFCSTDHGRSFAKITSFSKKDLGTEEDDIVSIEGSALRWSDDCVELYVSTEKARIAYPHELQEYQKPGTGVWSIDRLTAESIDGLKNSVIQCIAQSNDPQHLHVKDPVVYERPDGGVVLLFCSHPYSWSSSNTGFMDLDQGGNNFSPPQFGCFPRGTTWDVAISRVTAVVDVPSIGIFQGIAASLVFYDGGESMRNLDEHAGAVQRPRGYSCEELGGVGYCLDGDIRRIQRLSVNQPTFVSPVGTGSLRYVDVLAGDDAFYATWQQSQTNGSQPLVIHRIDREQVCAILEDADKANQG